MQGHWVAGSGNALRHASTLAIPELVSELSPADWFDFLPFVIGNIVVPDNGARFQCPDYHLVL